MSIRIRLLLSYIIAVVVPVILSILAALFLAFAFHKAYNINFRGSHFSEIMDKASQTYENIKSVSSSNPEKLENLNYLKELDKKLVSINSGIIVIKNDKIIYSSELLRNSKIYREVARNSQRLGKEHKHEHDLYQDQTVIRKRDFYFKDNSQGTVYLITDVFWLEKREDVLEKYGITLFAVIIIILIGTNGLISYLVSKGIIGPLESLKSAANKIKEGNLDFKVVPESKDEIGELCLAFEEMRCKLKESMEIQQQYENNRKELISNISHDLKTPVTAIKGYVEGIMDGVADSPEKMNKYINTIYLKASDMDRLIDELFLFSKLDLRKIPFNFEKIDIVKYLEDCSEELQFDLEKRGIQLSLLVDYDSKELVMADREKLKRVFANIIQNSAKHMDKDFCKIDIKLTENNDSAIIEIEDNGKGISMEALPFIFDRFYREDPSRNTSSGGSGLGLAIAKQIIEEHGGKIWAESETGKGTSIFFTLRKVC